MNSSYLPAVLVCGLGMASYGACSQESDTTSATGGSGTTSTCDPGDYCSPTDSAAYTEGKTHATGNIACSVNADCCLVYASGEAPEGYLVSANDQADVRALFSQAFEGSCNCNTAACISARVIAFCADDGLCSACEVEPFGELGHTGDFCGEETMSAAQCYGANQGGGGQGGSGGNAGAGAEGGAGGNAGGAGGGQRDGDRGGAGGGPDHDPPPFGCSHV